MSNEIKTDALRLVQELRLAACGLFTLKNETGDYGYFDTLADRVEALAAAPASPLPGGGWQDISTAPRTGEEFQAWWKGTWQPRARFDPEYGSFQLWGRTDFDTEGWEVFEIDGFWQPQPAAPTGDA